MAFLILCFTFKKLIMKKRIIWSLILVCSMRSIGFTQNTVGIISNQEEKVFEGYNLIFPHNHSKVYLFDNCGRVVHKWEDETGVVPGNAVYLLENGNLIKCKRQFSSGMNDPIWAGGGGETVEIRSWENELLHSFTLNDSLFRLHHDIAPMPNGNILMIAWANKNYEQSIAVGRDTALLAQDKVWSEVVLEWDPVLDSIVWKWDAWDHLVQNYDETKPSFLQPGNRPELININYDEHDGHPDWLHINAIDYNPVLDQIVLSVPYFNEFWIIDHSTTTEEAASHSGGNSGKGGDLLYRWGNPQAYSRGTEEDQQLFFQHDVHWVDPSAMSGDDDYGKIALFNNRLPNGKSSGHTIQTLVDGEYTFKNSVYAPETFGETFIYPKEDERAFSSSVSSFQLLPNGNALLLAGRWGFAYELTPQQDIVWEYIVPMKAGGPISQGDTLAINNNFTFRLKRFGTEYSAFNEKTLTPNGYIELNPNEGFCGLISSNHSIQSQDQILVYPNPASQQLFIETKNRDINQLTIFDLQGRLIKEISLHAKGGHGSANNITINISDLEKGMYLIRGDYNFAKKIVVY